MKSVKIKSVDTESFSPLKRISVNGIKYSFSHQIGKGNYTTVYQAKDEWGNALAVKVYSPEVKASLWQNEVKQMKRFAGPNVVYLYNVFRHQDYTYLIMNDGGTAVSRCQFDSPEDCIKVAIFTAKHVLETLNLMHKAGYCHGDINPQNVLIKTDTNQKMSAVTIIDFALARSFEQITQGKFTMALWVPPPEYFEKKPLIGPAVDIWHIAVLLLQILKAEILDYSEQDILQGKPLKDAAALDLPISRCLLPALSHDPTKRPSALELWRSICAAMKN